MDAADSFAAHSFREVTHNVSCSAVIAVPAATVVKTLKNIESIKRYGVDGGVIGCCVMENLVPPTEVGAVRRCTLRLPPYADKLIREKLTHYTEFRSQSNPSSSIGGTTNAAQSLSGHEGGELKSVEMSLEYVPCEDGDRSRAPFDAVVDDAVHSTRTHIRVSAVTRTPHRCFVEMNATSVLRVHEGRHVTTEQKLQDKACEQAVRSFWHLYLDAQLGALEAQVCREAYPDVEAPVETEFRTAFAAHEELLCRWAVEGGATLPRPVVTDELEEVLVWWARALQAYRHQKMLTEIAEAQVGRVGPSSLALTRPLPRRLTEAPRQSSATRRASDALSKAGSVIAAGDGANLSTNTQGSQSNMDMPMPGFMPPRSLTSVPVSPNAFLRSGSRGPATTMSETSRQSMLLPRDRRHTAVPKKSLVSGTSLPESSLPVKSASPASSALASPNAMNTSASAVLQTSVTSHSGRRKPTAQQPPHLLQHAQRRLSNMNSLSNSVSRYSAASTNNSRGATANAAAAAAAGGAGAAPQGNVSEPAGFFFSQFFRTPTYHATTPDSGLGNAGPAQRSFTATTAASGAAGGTAETTAAGGGSLPGLGARGSSLTTNATPSTPPFLSAASAATQAPSSNQSRSTGPTTTATTLIATTAAVPATSTPDVIDPFQPDMVRHLFSLTGVLHEDVARRIFFSLCSHHNQSNSNSGMGATVQDGSNAVPRLNAEGLKTVLRHVDLCGLREGAASTRGGDAAACEEAYRAEVQRCYYEQNTRKSAATAAGAASSFLNSGTGAPGAGASARKSNGNGGNGRRGSSRAGDGNGGAAVVAASATPAATTTAAAATDGGAATAAQPPTETLTTLSRLTAQREASRKERDEMALDKLTQSLLSRFAYQRKRELSYEEFQLALVYLWNN